MLHVNFLTLLRALEVNIDLRHVNHIRYYYYLLLSANAHRVPSSVAVYKPDRLISQPLERHRCSNLQVY